MSKTLLRSFLAAMLALCSGGSALAQAPDVADLIERNAAFLKQDKANPAIGYAFGMHFVSTVTLNGTVWAYYVRWDSSQPGPALGGVGLAKSTDGVNFTDHGWVLQAGPAGSIDNKYASFPGVWYEAGVFYMVYEAASDADNGVIALATSTDGINFVKQGAILDHPDTGWERLNIGTPSLYRENGVWYLHYHGFDGYSCQIGVATGTDLMNLSKYSGNPVIASVPGKWLHGTAGRRDIVKRDGKYYMVFEGSTQPPYAQADWSWGFASSTNLLDWTQAPHNPAIAPTRQRYGNDGPAFLSVGGSNYVYYHDGYSSTRRALIADETHGGFERQWAMNSSGIGHVVGRAESDGGWSASVADSPNFLQYGPYATGLGVGEHIATWKLMIDNNVDGAESIVRLEVIDATDNWKVLASREVNRRDWKSTWNYEYFSVPFVLDAARAGHAIEMRVWWYGHAYVRQGLLGVN